MHPLPSNAAVPAAAEMLRRWIGLDAATIGPSAIERAVRTCMAASGESDAAAFAARLDADDALRDRLVEEIVVAESWFFRDPQVFEVFRSFVAARAAAPGRRPLRILCVPCAAGEEPYSAAMVLLDAGWPATRFTIDAIDVSRTRLARAASATYFANAFRNADLGFRDRWFRVEGAAARLDDAVRRTVRFAWGNILDDAFVADRDAYDVIFCRNLLIYLTADARARVEHVLERLLAPDGIVVLGAAEPPILRGPWIPAAEHSSFTLRRGPRPSSSPSAPASRRPPRPAPAGVVGVQAPDPRGASPGAWGPDAPAADSARKPRQAAVESAGAAAVDDVLREAGRLANLGRHAEALRLCERHERERGPSPEIFFLMAMLHHSAGDLDRAEGCLHKTLYLDAGHEDAILALALVATRRGDVAMAEHYRRSAARVVARKEAR